MVRGGSRDHGLQIDGRIGYAPSMGGPSIARTSLLTLLTLVAFAGNSVLCRMALKDGAIDPMGFTGLRLLGGALVLVPVLRRGERPWSARSALALVGYAVAFSMAYVSLGAGTGALILFGCVQFTMIGTGLACGERPTALAWVGIALAIVGVVVLVLPGVSAPHPGGAGLMALAGVGWGVYSLLGRGVPSPVRATACNFVLAAPVGVLALVVSRFREGVSWTSEGVLLALASGIITSGLGYVIWYAALGGHTATSAAVVQLAVPLVAAVAGVVLLDEPTSMRLFGAAVLTLGGVALAILSKERAPSAQGR